MKSVRFGGGVVLSSCLINEDERRSFEAEDDFVDSRSLMDLRELPEELEVEVGSAYFSRSFELLDDETWGGGETERE